MKRSSSQKIVPFDSKEGRLRLERAKHKSAFTRIAPHFEPQENPYICAIACTAIALNALKWNPKRPITQAALLSTRLDRIKSRRELTGTRPGLTLDQTARLMRLHGLKVSVHRATRPESTHFKKSLCQILGGNQGLIVANFSYEPILGIQSGHLSPLGAYDTASDSILVLDVAKHRTLWYWAPTDLLYRAMNSRDCESQLERGFLAITLG